eukprot:Nitzschia sp. Nitz4//scaffold179_size51476//3412//4530//NITZ4_006920-RA/size51476-augustus-gene-0.34-mRNA-1//-1//CDS//3329539198//6015//frame0
MCIYDVYGPCSCPHGRCFTVLAQCFTVSAFVTSVVAVTSCFYMYVREIPEEGETEQPRVGFGYLSRQIGVEEAPNYYGTCVFYDADEKDMYFDSMWRLGKSMSLLACGIGGIVMGIMACTCCVAYQMPTFDGLFWTCMFCFVAQALTFLSWGSSMCDEYECTWSSGTGMNITAAMLWVWAANMIKSFPEALPPRGRGRSRKQPLYNDNDPYAPHDFPDEYDDEYDDEEGEFQNDGEYYDDYDDDDYYDDDDQYYDDDEYYDDGQEPEGYLDGDEGYADPYEEGEPYETDYEEPRNAYKQGRDDEFEPDPHFRDSWKEGEDDSDFRVGKESSFRGID